MQRTPPEIPSGWYLVAYSDEIAPGELRRLSYLEREMVAFRGEDGEASVFDAYCPHLGAHFGVGGKIENGTLRCPFHGWRFAASGECVEIPYASRIPPRARALRYESVERNGHLHVWYDAQGKPPFFEVPEVPEWRDDEFTRRWTRYEWTIASHPQEMAENGIDWQHFPFVHHMDAPRGVRSRFVGPSYQWSIESGKEYTLQALTESFDLWGENWGIGYSVTRQRGAFETVIVTGMTPVDRGHVCIKLGVIARRDGRSEAEALGVLGRYMEEHAVVATQDFHIWENKLFRPTPVLCEEDGPIAEYRRWAQQFYAAGAPA
jgi:nitrite reductase/ring-hydroxylating ferredoxin subunit